MTLGLPGHLARDSLSRALAHAGHCAAWVCLGLAAIIGVIGATAGGDPAGWTAALLATTLVVLLALVARFQTVALTLAYLGVGTGVVLVLTVLVMEPENGFESTNNVILALPRVAVLLVGGAGAGSVIAITWATLGSLLGEAASFLGAALAGGVWSPNLAAAMAFGIVLIARAFDGLTRRPNSRRATGLGRAGRQVRELSVRHDAELHATARLRATTLGHLTAIAAAGSGPVDERVRSGIRQDLGLIVGRDWALDHRRGVATDEAVGRIDTPFADALAAAASVGLEVRVTGDVAALRVLGAQRAAALDAAVAQCLVNVARHAGVREAEVALGLGVGEVVVAVVDSGTGFDEGEVPADRIGLRTSIRGRIEGEGGTVHLWSTKGIGTTIVLTLPEGGS